MKKKPKLISLKTVEHNAASILAYVHLSVQAPIFQIDNGIATIIGVTSWGAACGYADYPDIMGRVTKALDWIYDTIREYP